MNTPDYFDLLEKNDVASARTPIGFDYLKAKKEVSELQASLEPHLGFKPLVDGQIQDATHFEELNIQPKISREICPLIRFSKFGRLVTILFQEKLSTETLNQILSELKRHGYVYVPATVLETPYNGKVDGIETWMTRFFYFI